jgi:hypothetical protein
MIKHEAKDIVFIVNNLYPDVRRIINTLQKCSWEGKLQVDEEALL